jgi:hypothetical protein
MFIEEVLANISAFVWRCTVEGRDCGTTLPIPESFRIGEYHAVGERDTFVCVNAE